MWCPVYVLTLMHDILFKEIFMLGKRGVTVNPIHCVRGVVNWWMHSSQTSSPLASKEMNFLDYHHLSRYLLFYCQLSILHINSLRARNGSSLGCDDMLTLRNFYVIIITFWSSQGNLSSKKSKKTEEWWSHKNVSR